MNVLLIAVDAAAIDWMMLAVSIRGHTALRADDGQSALQRLTETTCELIIIGDLIGDEERTRLCRQIRMSPQARTATIWVVVDADQPAAVMSAIDAGATSYLSLPLDAHQLRERFETIEHEPAAVPAPPVQSGADVQRLIELISDPAAIVDGLGRIQQVSPHFEQLLGYASDELYGINIETCTHTDDIPLLLASIRAATADLRSTAAVNVRLQRRDQRWQPVELHCVDMHHYPAVGGILLLARVAADPELNTQEIVPPPIIDPIAGGIGSDLFHEHLTLALARGERANRVSAVILLDLPDTTGQPLNDFIRTRITDQIRGTIRSSDVVAQFSDNAWGILADEISGSDAVNAITRRLRAAWEALQNDLPITQPAIGAAVSQPGKTTLSSILREAELAIQPSTAGQHTSTSVEPPDDDDSAAAGPGRSVANATAIVDGEPEHADPSATDDSQQETGISIQRLDVIDRFLALEANLAQFLNDQPK